MSEYIEREALMRNLKQFAPEQLTPLIESLIQKQPAEDVVEVRHGEWKLKQYEGGILDGEIYDECSICEYQRFFDDIRFKTAFNYCPNCGAKMDLEDMKDGKTD